MSGLRIRPGRPGDFEAVAAFVAPRNALPESRFTAWGETPEEVRSELHDLGGPPEERLLVAEWDGRITGAIALAWDPATARGWCVGPWAASPETGEALFREFLTRLPAGFRRMDTNADAANAAAHALYLAHGFHEHKHAHVLVAPRPEGTRFGGNPGPDLLPGEEEAFRVLHHEAFPDATRDARTLLGCRGPDRRILVAREEGAPVGYLCAEVVESPREGFVLYLGVAGHARRRGIGRSLLRRALAWFFDERGLPQAALVVDDLNAHARRLYQDAGFAPFREVAVTRRLFPEPAPRRPDTP